MRIYSLPTKRSSACGSISRTAILVGAGIFLAGLCALVLFRYGTATTAAFVLSPIASTKTWFLDSSAALPSYLRTQHALVERVRSLETALADRSADRERIVALTAENTALLGGAPPTASTTRARVILQPPTIPYDTLLIDRGSDAGLTSGAYVYAPEGVMIGTVAAVYRNSALIELVTTPDRVSTAYLFGPDIFVEARGMGGGTLEIAVPQEIPLAAGNILALPVMGAGIYGEVVDVVSHEASPDRYGYVRAPVKLSSLRYVHVATTPPPSIDYATAQDAIAEAEERLRIELPANARIATSTATTTQDL